MVLRIGMGAVLVAVLVAASLYRVSTTFSINAVTQLVELTTGPEHRSPWYFENARIQMGGDRGVSSFTGQMTVKPDTHVVIERLGTGPLHLRCSSTEKGRT